MMWTKPFLCSFKVISVTRSQAISVFRYFIHILNAMVPQLTVLFKCLFLLASWCAVKERFFSVLLWKSNTFSQNKLKKKIQLNLLWCQLCISNWFFFSLMCALKHIHNETKGSLFNLKSYDKNDKCLMCHIISFVWQKEKLHKRNGSLKIACLSNISNTIMLSIYNAMTNVCPKTIQQSNTDLRTKHKICIHKF